MQGEEEEEEVEEKLAHKAGTLNMLRGTLPGGLVGLCCGAMLARYGYRVTVCESHYLPGGAAHSFDVKGFQFDAGPSFFAGISGPIPGYLVPAVIRRDLKLTL
jgi:NAD(P)-binding Rossmann-like domain